MATNSALAQGLQGYNFMLTPDANVKLRQIGQESTLADALRQQGMTPIDTSNRQIGGVGYKISPMEGVAKIAQQLAGIYGQSDSNDKFSDLVNPQPVAAPSPTPDANAPPTSDGDSPPTVGAPGYAALPDAAPPQQGGQQGPYSSMFTSAVQNLMARTGMSQMDAMQIAQDPTALARVWASLAPTPEMKNAQFAYGAQGAPGAVGNIMNLQQYPGQKTMQESVGTAAAGMQPAGALPPGPAAARPALLSPQGPSGYQVTPDGIRLSGNAPPAQGMGGNVNAAALEAAQAAMPKGQAQAGVTQPAGASPMAPPNPAGMTNDQYQAALATWKAGQSANATKAGENLADAQKGQASIDSRIGVAKNTLQHIIDLSPNTSSGMGVGMKEDLANQFNGKLAANNADFTNASARLFLQEMPAVMSSLSNRGNQFMERAIQEAGSIDLGMHPEAKMRVAQRLMTALDQAKDMQDTNVQALGGQAAAPTQNTTNWVMQNGRLVKQ